MRAWSTSSRYAKTGRSARERAAAATNTASSRSATNYRTSSSSKLIEQPIPRRRTDGGGAIARDVQFSTAVAGFAQLLRGGQYTGIQLRRRDPAGAGRARRRPVRLSQRVRAARAPRSKRARNVIYFCVLTLKPAGMSKTSAGRSEAAIFARTSPRRLSGAFVWPVSDRRWRGRNRSVSRTSSVQAGRSGNP